MNLRQDYTRLLGLRLNTGEYLILHEASKSFLGKQQMLDIRL